MVRPLVEKTPLVVLQWSDKALQQQQQIVGLVKERLQASGVRLIPSSAEDILILSTTVDALEQEAELSRLVKERHIMSDDDVIMDHFAVAHREEFGPFTTHERAYLTLEMIRRIHIPADGALAQLLVDAGSHAHSHLKEDTSGQIPLRHILQSHGWIKILTPLHVDAERLHVQQQTCYNPLWRFRPPVDLIQEYYGPSIAFYFAFVGFLGQWLGALGVLGLATMAFRVYRHDTIDTDEYTPFYGLACFVWAVLLTKFWDREEHCLAYKWGTLDLTNNLVDDMENDYTLDVDYSHVRPQFRGELRTSPITQLPELYYSPFRRKIHYVLSGCVTAFMLGIAFFIMILSLNLQGYILPRRKTYHPFHYPYLASLAEEGNLFDPNTYMSYIPVVAHVACILTLNTIYRSISTKLTDWENHRTQDAYDNSLILKRFFFEAFDCYVVLFYLAFYERNVDRLRSELIAVFNVDSFRRLFMEVIVPLLMHQQVRRKSDEHPQDIDLDEYEPFDDYIEILLQFGYVTLFASAYPLASLVMCLAVLIETKTDCYKLTFVCQKPNAERVPTIGMWKTLLNGMVWTSCLTNCLLFGYTSEQMMQYLPSLYVEDETGDAHLVHDKGWIAIFVIFALERVMIALGLALQAIIPSIPESLKIQLHRRRYLLSSAKKKKNLQKKTQ